MKEKLLLVGAGGFGRVVLEHAAKLYDCSFVDDGCEKGSRVCGAEVVGGTADLPELFGTFHSLIVSIGNNRVRERICRTAAEIGYSFPNIICPSVYISPFAKIGKGCIFLNNAVIQNNVSVGNGVILNPGVELHHDSTVGNYVLVYTNSVVRSLAKIGDRVCLGSTLTVSNGVIVPEDNVVKDGCMICG